MAYVCMRHDRAAVQDEECEAGKRWDAVDGLGQGDGSISRRLADRRDQLQNDGGLDGSSQGRTQIEQHHLKIMPEGHGGLVGSATPRMLDGIWTMDGRPSLPFLAWRMHLEQFVVDRGGCEPHALAPV